MPVKIFPKRFSFENKNYFKSIKCIYQSRKSISYKCFNIGLIRRHKSCKKLIEHTLKVVISQNFVNLRSVNMKYADIYIQHLKLVSDIFIKFLFFHQIIVLQKLWKVFLFHLKSSFHSQDFQIFLIFSLSFHNFQIQKDKWKINNLWCHELACINLQMQFLE